MADDTVAPCCEERADDESLGLYAIRAETGSGWFKLYNNGAGPGPSRDFVAYIRYCPLCGKELTRG